jgi:hypothetical protein
MDLAMPFQSPELSCSDSPVSTLPSKFWAEKTQLKPLGIYRTFHHTQKRPKIGAARGNSHDDTKNHPKNHKNEPERPPKAQ